MLVCLNRVGWKEPRKVRSSKRKVEGALLHQLPYNRADPSHAAAARVWLCHLPAFCTSSDEPSSLAAWSSLVVDSCQYHWPAGSVMPSSRDSAGRLSTPHQPFVTSTLDDRKVQDRLEEVFGLVRAKTGFFSHTHTMIMSIWLPQTATPMSTMSMPQMQLTTLTRRWKSTYVYDPLAWQLVCRH